MESLDLAREVVEGDDGRNCDEDTQGRRDQGLSDAARNHRHSAGPSGRDAPESVDDSDHGAEKTNERGSGADRGKNSETPLQLNQRFGYGVPECARDELERSDRIASTLAYTVVLDDARRDHLRHVGILVLTRGFDQILDISPVKELLEFGRELFLLARGSGEAAVLFYDHPHRKNGEQGEAKDHRASEYTYVSQQFSQTHCFLLCASRAAAAAFPSVVAPLGRAVSDRIS